MASPTPTARARRVAIVTDDASELITSHQQLIRDLVTRNHRVICIAGNARENDLAVLKAIGATAHELPAETNRPAIVGRWLSSDPLIDVIQDWQPQVVLGIGGPAMARAIAAAKRAEIDHVVSIPGRLPAHRFTSSPAAGELSPRTLAASLSACDYIVFHNEADFRLCEARDLLPETTPIDIMPAIGIDPTRISELPMPATGNGLVFLMTARLERMSGILVFCESANRIRALAPDVRFVLGHRPGSGEGTLVADDLQQYTDAVELHDLDTATNATADKTRDALFAAAHVFVYPSYGEATSIDVVTAMATSRPIITTTAPGCGETVDERVNGILISPGDVSELTAAIQATMLQPGLLASMGHASRLKAERRYDVRDINNLLCEILKLA